MNSRQNPGINPGIRTAKSRNPRIGKTGREWTCSSMCTSDKHSVRRMSRKRWESSL